LKIIFNFFLNSDNKKQIIKNEIVSFIEKIQNENFNSTSKFWLDHKKVFPNLYYLALRLFNIPASSAFIEQYFSQTGNIKPSQCCNMEPDLLEMRSMLKANLNII